MKRTISANRTAAASDTPTAISTTAVRDVGEAAAAAAVDDDDDDEGDDDGDGFCRVELTAGGGAVEKPVANIITSL